MIMGMEYDGKGKLRYCLLLLCVGFFAIAALCFLECFYPFGSKVAGIGSFTPALLCLALGGFSLFFFWKMPSLSPEKTCKWFGILGMAVFPLILLAAFLLAFLMPRTLFASGVTPFFVVELVAFFVQFSACLLVLLLLRGRINGGNHGLLPTFTHVAIATMFSFLLFSAYIVALCRYSFIPNLNYEKLSIEDPSTISYLITLFVQVLVGFLLSLVMFALSFLTFIAGKEKHVLGFRGTFKLTMSLVERYDVLFWVGNMVTFGLLILAIGSAIRLGPSHLSFVSLYGILLLIRVPGYFWGKKIDKDEALAYRRFRKYHHILIYGSVWLFILFILVFLLGEASTNRMQVESSAFMTYVIFVPWAIFKTFMGIKERLKAKRLGDPNLLYKSYLDLLTAIVTVNSTIFYIANFFRGGEPFGPTMSRTAAVFYLVGLIFVILELAYIFYVAITLLVLGILGLKDKRRKYFEKHRRYFEIKALPVNEGEEAAS